jgi:hypothetical protein
MNAHVTVCICTYCRPEMLRQILEALHNQRTANKFTFPLSSVTMMSSLHLAMWPSSSYRPPDQLLRFLQSL